MAERPVTTQPDGAEPPQKPLSRFTRYMATLSRKPAARTGMAKESVWLRDKDLSAKVAAQSTKDLRGKALLTLSFSALGVIFGDLGTSPLYALQAVFIDPPRSAEDVLGVVSLVFWTFTLLALLKYVVWVLNANDNGEGGTFALYSLLCRAIGIGPYGEQLPIDTAVFNYDNETYKGGFLRCGVHHPAGARLRVLIRRHKALQVALLVLVVVASTMLIGDGCLTPSISVLSAVTGLRLASDAITQPVIVGITIVILVLLFMLQRVGTHRVSSIFAPVIFLWLVSNAAIGFYNLSMYGWGAFRALSPSYGIQQFTSGFHMGWARLGGVVLAITGVEAMFADLGHFSRPAVTISFCCAVYPLLMITYLGQGAFLIAHPEAHDDPYWHSIPHAVFWPMLIVATFATIVASQALISGAFSMMRQAMMIGVFPRLTVMHTSEHVAGQVYIEEVNFLLMIACVAVVAGFQNTTSLGNAYGVAVVTDMFFTTNLFALIMLLVWRLHPLLVLAFYLFFGLIEGLYISAVYTKVPMGGWVALMISALVTAFELTFWYGSRKKSQYTRAHIVPSSQLFAVDSSDSQDGATDTGSDPKGPSPTSGPGWQRQLSGGSASCKQVVAIGGRKVVLQQLRLAVTGQPLARMPGLGVVYSETVAGAPLVLQHLLRNMPVVFEVNVFLTLRFITIPYIGRSEQFLVRSSQIQGIYHVVARYGYMDVVDQGEAFLRDIITNIALSIQQPEVPRSDPQVPTRPNSPDSPHSPDRPDSPDHHTIDIGTAPGLQRTSRPPPAAPGGAAPGRMLRWLSMQVPSEAATLLDMEPEQAVEASKHQRHLAASSLPPRPLATQSRRRLNRLSTVAERRVRMALMETEAVALLRATSGSHEPGAAGAGAAPQHDSSAPAWAAEQETAPVKGPAMSVVFSFSEAWSAAEHSGAFASEQRQEGAPGGAADGGASAGSAAGAGGIDDSAQHSAKQQQSGLPGVTADSGADSGAAPQHSMGQQQEELLLLLDAYKRHKVFIAGHSRVMCTPGSNYVKRVVIGFYRFIVANAKSATDAWAVPREHLLEVTHDVKV